MRTNEYGWGYCRKWDDWFTDQRNDHDPVFNRTCDGYEIPEHNMPEPFT